MLNFHGKCERKIFSPSFPQSFFCRPENDNSFVRMYYIVSVTVYHNQQRPSKWLFQLNPQMVIPTEPNKTRANVTSCAWLHPDRANETGCAWLYPERANEISCMWRHPESYETGCAWLYPERANETGCMRLHPES